jgi:hypothetical protein
LTTGFCAPRFAEPEQLFGAALQPRFHAEHPKTISGDAQRPQFAAGADECQAAFFAAEK